MQNQDYLKLLVEQLHFTTVATLGAEGSKILAAKSWTRFLKRTPKKPSRKGKAFLIASQPLTQADALGTIFLESIVEVKAMQYTQHYDSPLGGILLAADEVGLTGLWFDGAKILCGRAGPGVPGRSYTGPFAGKTLAGYLLQRAGAGFHPRRCTPAARPSGRRYGRCCVRFRMGRPQPTVHWPPGWRRNAALPKCPRRPWAARSGTTRFPSSYPATALSAQTAA